MELAQVSQSAIEKQSASNAPDGSLHSPNCSCALPQQSAENAEQLALFADRKRYQASSLVVAVLRDRCNQMIRSGVSPSVIRESLLLVESELVERHDLYLPREQS